MMFRAAEPLGIDIGEPGVKAGTGGWSFAQPSSKQLLLAFKLCQSVTQGAAVVSLLDGSDNSSDLAFDGLKLQPIGLDLLLKLGRRGIGFLLEGSNELAHEFRSHQSGTDGCRTGSA